MDRNDDLGHGDDDPVATRVLASLLAERRSCRAFRPEPVQKALIERILRLSQFTASWCNTQPWHIILTSGKALDMLRDALVEDVVTNRASHPDFAFPERHTGAYLARKREVGYQLYESMGIARGDREASARAAMRNFTFFGAPHLAVITSERDLGTYGAVDCGLYIANFMLVAQSFGLATIAQAAIAQRAPFLRRHFDLPPERVVVAGLSFGYADESHCANAFNSSRADLHDVVRWVE